MPALHLSKLDPFHMIFYVESRGCALFPFFSFFLDGVSNIMLDFSICWQIVMEYCGGGSVADLMNVTDEPLEEYQIAYICKEALKVL